MKHIEDGISMSWLHFYCYLYFMTIFHFSNKNRTLSDEDFEIIYKTYYSRLYYYTFQFITDEENSKDIVNDVFEKSGFSVMS